MKREPKNFGVQADLAARIFYGERVRPCIVSNLSNGGAKITGVRTYTFPREFMLRATPHGRIHKCQVLWRTDDALGVRFADWDTGAATPIAATTARELTGLVVSSIADASTTNTLSTAQPRGPPASPSLKSVSCAPSNPHAPPLQFPCAHPRATFPIFVSRDQSSAAAAQQSGDPTAPLMHRVI